MIGYCWGAKVVSLSAGGETPFSVAAEVHPSMIDPVDGKNISIPIVILASGDEDAKEVQAFVDNIKGPKYFETYDKMPHVSPQVYTLSSSRLLMIYTRVGWLRGRSSHFT